MSTGAARVEPFRSTVRSMLRERLLDAAAEAFADQGWRRLTMARVADLAGVSRQTVYNEFGSKPQLAEQLVMRELDTFLAVVSARFQAESDFVAAVRAAILGALETAQHNALLRAILESSHTGDTDLLPYIQSRGLIDTATTFLHDLVRQGYPELPIAPADLEVALESVVRLVLSHITQPAKPPRETADDLGVVVGALLAGVPHVARDRSGSATAETVDR